MRRPPAAAAAATLAGIAAVVLCQLYLGWSAVPGSASPPKSGPLRRPPVLVPVRAAVQGQGQGQGPVALRPFFRCASSSRGAFRTTKLVFVHVFKTAGSTVRNFFDAYSDYCSAGWAIIVGCSSVDADTLGGDGAGPAIWNATRPLPGEPPCSIKRSWNRAGHLASRTPVNGRYVARDLDVVGGHLPLGVGGAWTEAGPTVLPAEIRGRIDVRYLTFVRNSVDKFVSGTSYKTPEPTVGSVVEKIRDDVVRRLAESQYQAKYAEYFVTPAQRKEMEAGGAPPPYVEELLVRQMANLLEFDVVVGTTERMSDSLRLLQSLLDPGGEATEIFEEFGMGAEEGDASEGSVGGGMTRHQPPDGGGRTVINPSRLSTRSIVERLREDELLFLDVLEYTKYEQQISDFCLALHLRQYSARPEVGYGNGTQR